MMTTMANKKRSDKSFEVKDYVYLKVQPYIQQSATHRSSQKLVAKYYGPYQVVAKVGRVVYKINLPPTTLIHPVFHVSPLKRHIGNHTVEDVPPIFPRTPDLQPRTILERQMARCKTQTITQVLVYWNGLSLANATWKYINELKLRFPQFNLEDKVGLKGGNCYQLKKTTKKKFVL